MGTIEAVDSQHPVRRERKRALRLWFAAAVAMVLLLVANGLYRNKTADLWHHPDQAIPVHVLQGMHDRQDWNTDWAETALPDYFRVCRYNFSGYMVASYAALSMFSPKAFDDRERLTEALLRFSRLLSALTVVLVFMLLAWRIGILQGIAGAIATALVPQLLQDANYARPEALSTFCFTLCFGACLLRPPGWLRWLQLGGIALLAGFLASIKFTYAVALLFAWMPARQWSMTLLQKSALLPLPLMVAVVAALAFFLGFAAGAPAAVMDAAGYFEGLDALRRQYGGGHPPHGRLQAGIMAQAGMIGEYYLATIGWLMLVLHGLGYAGKTLAPAKYAFAAILATTLAGFLLQKVFFERNFSLLIPGFIMIAVAGLSMISSRVMALIPGAGGRRVIVILMSALIFVISQLRPMGVSYDLAALFKREGFVAMRDARRLKEEEVQRSIGAEAVLHLPFPDVHARRYPNGSTCTLYVADTYNDDWSRRFINELPARYAVIEVVPSLFADVPTSTLHTYHSSTRYLFVDKTYCVERS